MIHMQRGIEDSSEAMARALARINLNPEQLRDLSADQQLRQIAGGFSQLTSQGERASVAMALFGLPDIRLLIENDQRFLAQFNS